MKGKVEEKKAMIEDIIRSIEEESLIEEKHFKKVYLESEKTGDYYSLGRFYQQFEAEIRKKVTGLGEKYKKIGDTMLPQIEFVIFGSQNRRCK